MKHFNPSPALLSLVLAFFFIVTGLSSCNRGGKTLVQTDPSTGFPTLIITNPFGDDVTLQPVSEIIGSIGFDIDGEIIWLKGEPDIKETSGGITRYLWKTDSDNTVEILITAENDEINIHLALVEQVTGKQPLRWFINLAATEDEFFTGIFERVVDGHQRNSWEKGLQTALNLRNEKVEMMIKPTVSAYAPFYLSSNNYGLFVKGTWPGVFDFCKDYPNIVQVAFEGPLLDFKLYFRSTPMEIVSRHALETGPSFVPPEWVFGPWRWRDEHINNPEYFDGTTVHAPYNSALVEDVLLMKAYDIPCTAYWIDRPWGFGSRGFDDYEFDTIRFPQPEEMINWLNDNNIELMMWIAPFVMGKMADYAEENGYDLVSKPWYNSRQILIDFSNPEACQWWGENGPGKLARMGIKGFKLDRGDGEKLTDSIHLKTIAGLTYRENYNDYTRQYVKAAYEAVNPVLNGDFLLFPRGQYTGSSRYGGMWAGDIGGTPEGLRAAIIAMQRCAVMGYPVWGSDIGGYWGGFDRETCMRWLGFGCFSPIMETGPTNNQGFWNNPDEPHFDTELIATWRLYSQVRMKLIPYIHSLAKEAGSAGTPIARPLFLEYPGQQSAWEDWQTYLFGPDILVSAIWDQGKNMHKMYLPAGETWIDAWDSNKEYTGGDYIEVEAPAYKIPLFIRKGSSVDLGDLNELYAESLEMAQQRKDLNLLEAAEGW